MSLYTLFETNPNGYKYEFLILLSLIAITLAIFTIVTKSPIYSILYLIGLFVAVSLYLIGHKLYFMGISYILVYVGAISILFLFILMLINVRISELLTEGRNSMVLSILVVVVFSVIFNSKLPNTANLYIQLYNLLDYLGINAIISFFYNINTVTYLVSSNNSVSIVSSNSWDSSLIEISHISSIGNILYTLMFVTIMLLGMLLLLAIVGCIVTTVKPKDNVDHINTNTTPDYIKVTPLESGIDPESMKKLLEYLLRSLNSFINDENMGTDPNFSWYCRYVLPAYLLFMALYNRCGVGSFDWHMLVEALINLAPEPGLVDADPNVEAVPDYTPETMNRLVQYLNDAGLHNYNWSIFPQPHVFVAGPINVLSQEEVDALSLMSNEDIIAFALAMHDDIFDSLHRLSNLNEDMRHFSNAMAQLVGELFTAIDNSQQDIVLSHELLREVVNNVENTIGFYQRSMESTRSIQATYREVHQLGNHIASTINRIAQVYTFIDNRNIQLDPTTMTPLDRLLFEYGNARVDSQRERVLADYWREWLYMALVEWMDPDISDSDGTESD